MAESRTHLSTLSTAHPDHASPHSIHRTIHHTSSSSIATHTLAPSTTHAAPSSTAAGPTSTGFSYPTPTNVPNSSGVIMGLSLGIVFCILLLCGAGIALYLQRKSAKGKYEERVIRSVYGSDDETLAAGSANGAYGANGESEKEKKHRTWMGRKIVALVPGHEYGKEGFV